MDIKAMDVKEVLVDDAFVQLSFGFNPL